MQNKENLFDCLLPAPAWKWDRLLIRLTRLQCESLLFQSQCLLSVWRSVPHQIL